MITFPKTNEFTNCYSSTELPFQLKLMLISLVHHFVSLLLCSLVNKETKRSQDSSIFLVDFLNGCCVGEKDFLIASQ